jgi:hypothetical protein
MYSRLGANFAPTEKFAHSYLMLAPKLSWCLGTKLASFKKLPSGCIMRHACYSSRSLSGLAKELKLCKTWLIKKATQCLNQHNKPQMPWRPSYIVCIGNIVHRFRRLLQQEPLALFQVFTWENVPTLYITRHTWNKGSSVLKLTGKKWLETVGQGCQATGMVQPLSGANPTTFEFTASAPPL